MSAFWGAAFSARAEGIDLPARPQEEVHVDLVAGAVVAGHVASIGERKAKKPAKILMVICDPGPSDLLGFRPGFRYPSMTTSSSRDCYDSSRMA
jgi:hypothetical protein